MAFTTKRPFVRRFAGVSSIRKESYGKDWFDLAAKNRERLGHQCVGCKAIFQSKSEGDSHHIQRLSRRGANNLTNLTLLCDDCHRKRHKREAGEWSESRKRKNTWQSKS